MVNPQGIAGARQDVLVNDAASGEPRRLTVYTGTVWFAPPPQVSNPGGRFRIVASPGVESLDPTTPFRLFVPDSLRYRQGAEGVVSAAGAPLGSVDQTGVDARLLYPLVAELAPDPRGGDFAWVAFEARGQGRLHAMTYTISVTVPPDAVAE